MSIDDFLLTEITKNLSKGDSVLDIGGGNGLYAKFCADKGLFVDVIDKEFSGISTPRVNFIKEDIRHWTAPDKKYDLIVARSMSHYLNPEEAARLLKQFPTILAEKGFLYITSLTPADNSRFLHKPEFIKANVLPLKICFLHEQQRQIGGETHYFWRMIFQKGNCNLDVDFLLKKINDLTKN